MTLLERDERMREEGRKEGLEKGRMEGLVKGREEGLEKGREEGLEKGREEGLEKGCMEERVNTAHEAARADAAEKEVLQLRAEIEALRKQFS